MATLAGQTLGQYQIIERLGRGGMAEVYKGFHPKLERYAAIKVLHGFLAEGEDFLARFQREAKAIAALSHPNIVQVYDFNTHDDFYYMVIEYVDGGTLKDRLVQSGGPLPLDEMVRIFKETASALDYAHRQGVLHRDIKPANILLDQNGRAVLTDFGIARILSDTQFTATGTLVGTPAYMSPEQGMGLHVSEASDIYALGIVLYEMLTGRVPFEADTPFGIIHKHINDPLPSTRTFCDNVPDSLETVLRKSLEKDPQNRYQSSAEMAVALDSAISGVVIQETRVESPKPAAKTDTQAGEAEATIASKTTVVMGREEEIAVKATVVMDVECVAEPDGVKVSEEPKEADVSEEPEGAAMIKKRRGAKRLPIFLGIVGVLVVALLIWGIPKLAGGGSVDCSGIDACHQLSEELLGQGDIEGSLFAIDTAIDYVAGNEHPVNASLWCLRGDILLALDRIDEAIGSFDTCMVWTEGDPGLEELRVFSQDKINMLSQR